MQLPARRVHDECMSKQDWSGDFPPHWVPEYALRMPFWRLALRPITDAPHLVAYVLLTVWPYFMGRCTSIIVISVSSNIMQI